MKIKEKLKTQDLYKDSLEKKSNDFVFSDFLLNLKNGIKKGRENFRFYLLNDEKDFWLMLLFSLISLCVTIFLSIKVYENIIYINKQYMKLIEIQNYKIESLNSNNQIKDVNDLIDIYLDKKNEELKHKGRIDTSTTSYEYLLQYIYLPRLNIWKNIYTEEIDTDLLGIKFIENNPYNDSALIYKWSNFFGDLGENNEGSRVSSITVGNFIEQSDQFFRIPINVSFEVKSKRSLLLLIDKLLITSNQENVGLINEFVYHLIQNIKKDKLEILDDLIEKANDGSDLKLFSDENKDNVYYKFIGYYIYNRVNNSGSAENDLIDESIITKTIREVVACEDNSSDEVCYYKFRNKYRDMPKLAYKIGRFDFNIDRVLSLKEFLAEMPPIIKINDLSFDKLKNISLNSDMQYVGKISIDVFGRGIFDSDVLEIADKLGEKCFTDGQTLNIEIALSKVNEIIKEMSGTGSLDFQKTKNFWQLTDIFNKIEKDYASMTNYNKIIKLFEIYRMLNESNLCEL